MVCWTTVGARITRSEAREIAVRAIARGLPGEHPVVRDDETIERPWGWIFFWGEPELIGATPIAVTAEDGSVEAVPTSAPVEDYVRRRERKRRWWHV